MGNKGSLKDDGGDQVDNEDVDVNLRVLCTDGENGGEDVVLGEEGKKCVSMLNCASSVSLTSTTSAWMLNCASSVSLTLTTLLSSRVPPTPSLVCSLSCFPVPSLFASLFKQLFAIFVHDFRFPEYS